MAANGREPKSWIATIPGILTALATLIGAITALYIALATHSRSGTTNPPRDGTTQAPDPPPKKTDPCKDLPVDQRPISCLDRGDN